MTVVNSSELERLTVFDTTLRDGEQGAGCDMSPDDKVRVALALEAAGVDVIEAGFPASNRVDLATIEEIVRVTSSSDICALARNVADVEIAARALAGAGERARIHVFVAMDERHMEIKLRRTPEEVLMMIQESVERAAELVPTVQWSPEVATSSDFDFLCQGIRVAIKAGASSYPSTRTLIS